MKLQNAELEPKFPTRFVMQLREEDDGPGDTLFALRKRLVPVPSASGRTELKCIVCDKLDPMDIPALKEWTDGPLAKPISEKAAGPQKRF
jgi:hypothetical protein